MKRLPDPMKGMKTMSGLVTLLVAGALLYFGKIDTRDFLSLAAAGGAVTGYGIAAKIERRR